MSFRGRGLESFRLERGSSGCRVQEFSARGFHRCLALYQARARVVNRSDDQPSATGRAWSRWIA